MRLVPIAVPISLALMAGDASAADWYTGYKPPQQDDTWVVSVDTSFNVTTQGSVYGDTEITLAPSGTLGESGTRVRLQGQAGMYNYKSNGERIDGSQETGSVMVGYEFVEPDITIAAYVGLLVQGNQLSPNDPNNPVKGTGAGLKVSAEFWANPTPETLIAGYGSYTTVHDGYYTRLRLGYAPFGLENGFIGPEVSFLGDDFFRQWRVGAHWSAIRFGRFQFGLSAGYLNDKVRGPGGYALMDSRVTF